MFSRDTQKEDARSLLNHDTIGDDDGIVWEHEQDSMRSDRTPTASMSEVWDQDPLSEMTTSTDHHHLDHNHNTPSSSSAAGGYAPPPPPHALPEDHVGGGEAAHEELDAEFQRIFSPVSLQQTEQTPLIQFLQ